MTQRIMKYNPAFLSEDELVASFHVRQADLELVVEAIGENTGPVNQHMLIVGPRGMGKTTLALRAVAEVRRDDTLSALWYPLVFSEESYEVTSPGEFWLEAIYHLAQQTKDDNWRRTFEDLRAESDEKRLRDRALGQLLDFADEQRKRILLVVENLNMLLGEQLNNEEAWVIRQTLQNESRVMFLATATSRNEEFENAGKAMFEQFRTLSLKPLTAQEAAAMWQAITGQPTDPRRIRPIQILTGGSPRLLTIISSFAVSESFDNLMQELVQLIDDHTDYFKSHLDALPTTERKVYLALADIWDPGSAREVATVARMEVSKTSALLNRLVERGAVVVVYEKPRKKTYQVAERLYNIYYLMRRRGEPSRRVKAIVNFMVDFYDEETLVNTTRRIFAEILKHGSAAPGEHFAACEAIFARVSDSVRQAIINGSPSEAFRLECMPESLRRFAEDGLPKTHEDEATSSIGGETSLPEGYLTSLRNRDWPAATDSILDAIEREGRKSYLLFQLGVLCEITEEPLDRVIQVMRRAIEEDPNDCDKWTCLGRVLSHRAENRAEAQVTLEHAISLDSREWLAWYFYAILLEKGMQKYEEAVAAYRVAIEINKNDFDTWASLGQLLHYRLSQYDEAEVAYRESIRLKSDEARTHVDLGGLLGYDLHRREEAEESFRQAIKLAPSSPFPWLALGMFFESVVLHFEKAEEAYREALEIDPKCEKAWGLLAEFLARQAGREHDFVVLFEQFVDADIEDPRVKNVFAWECFTLNLVEYMNQAEQLVADATRCVSDVSPANHTLACIMCANNKGVDALGPAQSYFQDAVCVQEDIDSAIELAASLFTAGVGRQTLGLIQQSPAAEDLEPLIVALQMLLGDEVKAPVEIVEVAKDVTVKIEEMQTKWLAVWPWAAFDDRDSEGGDVPGGSEDAT